jgi:DNA-binding MarR family transcriptional regulator
MRIEDEIQSKFKNEYHKLMVNIQLTANRISEKLQEEMKSHDLTITQFNVLRILRGQNEQAVSIGLIKERLIERNSDVSRIIDRLVKKELIERKENLIDRRQKDVFISKKGLATLSKIDKVESIFEESLGHLSIKEAEQLNNLLDKARNTTPTS